MAKCRYVFDGYSKWAVLGLLAVVVCGAGCAPARVSLREIREYDQGIKIAEANGVDTTEQHKRLVEMLVSYLEHPALNSDTVALQTAAQAASFDAAANVYQAFRPEPYAAPMSPGEYRRGR